jgi:sec-independent protein translocase protein TatA
MFSSIGWGEILLIVVIVVLLFGATKLPQIGQSLGRSITSFRKGLKETTEDVKAAIKEDADADTGSESKSDSDSPDTKSDAEKTD